MLKVDNIIVTVFKHKLMKKELAFVFILSTKEKISMCRILVREVMSMNSLILLVLIFVIINIAFKYLKVSRNTHERRDGFTTGPIGGGFAGNDEEIQDMDDPENLEEVDELLADESSQDEYYSDDKRLPEYQSKGAKPADYLTDIEEPAPEDVSLEPSEEDLSSRQEVVVDTEVRIDAQMTSDKDK